MNDRSVFRRPLIPILVLVAIAAGAVLHATRREDAAGVSAHASSAGASGPARVVRVVDGDTLKVRMADGRRKTVRVLQIDTPEVKRPDTPIECGGPQASAAMRRLALDGAGRGRAVTLVRDPSQDAVDRYGRVLAYVDLAGQDVGRTLVAQGWADVYVFQGHPGVRIAAYRRAGRQARSARRGVYGLCDGDFHSSRG
jgi:micrococcal nuclease